MIPNPTTPTIEESNWRERLANELYDHAMSGAFHGKTGLKIIPLTDFIREFVEQELTQQREHIAGEVEKIPPATRTECEDGMTKVIDAADVLTLLQTSPRSK